MAPKISERKQAILFAAVVVAAIAGLYAATQMMEPAPVRAAVVHQVHLRVDGLGWTIRYDPGATINNTAFSILIEASRNLRFAVSYIPYEIPKGMFVTSINGTANGQSGGLSWQFWVNGAYGTVASDHTALADNDSVVWAFTASQERS
ncbi:MAG TPA: DUF4430 domain-containing protein [Thermoplasmata archaeon]|nr:DUF4430 domain-containing protein [Thermoplasmata archaeon]